MASDLPFVEYVLEQIQENGRVHFKRMFGEFGFYYDDKIVALVCDNQFLVKPTEAGKSFLGAYEEAPPYPGCKPYLLVSELLDDREKILQLVQITAAQLPPPVPKKPKLPKKPKVSK